MMERCPAFFLSHGCDLAAGHPPELGHICLDPANDLLPDQGSYHDPVTFSRICYRVPVDSPEVFS